MNKNYIHIFFFILTAIFDALLCSLVLIWASHKDIGSLLMYQEREGVITDNTTQSKDSQLIIKVKMMVWLLGKRNWIKTWHRLQKLVLFQRNAADGVSQVAIKDVHFLCRFKIHKSNLSCWDPSISSSPAPAGDLENQR